jgi:hypothetical protein
MLFTYSFPRRRRRVPNICLTCTAAIGALFASLLDYSSYLSPSKKRDNSGVRLKLLLAEFSFYL